MPIPEQLPEQIHLALEIMMGLKGNQHQISTEEIQLLKIESSTPTYDEVKHAALDVLYETLIFLLSGHAEEQTVDLRQVAVELLKKIEENGGMSSMGFKRGSWVKHPKYGVCYVGGTLNGRVSLHNLQDGKRLTQNAKTDDCTFLTYSSWRVRKGEVSHSSPC